MKTSTRFQIVEIIRQNGLTRPNELAKSLKISLQAIHKHLRALVSDGVIEPKGRPPSTRYMMAGTADFGRAFKWFESSGIPEPAAEVSETRDVFSARLGRLALLENQGLRKEDLPLIISIVGEIGNNSFDHNLGQWRDVPGCWFEIQVTHHRLWTLIADRGQGIFRSLSGVIPVLNDQDALEKAFKEHISGRAPEKRGNGLKYVTNVIAERSAAGLACCSGSGQIHFGETGELCSNVVKAISEFDYGTITVLAWELI
jgi:hypothetical protein